MAIVCSNCGMYITPEVDKREQAIRCPRCQYVQPMRVLPLFIVTGASGAGKTAVVPELRDVLPDFEVFETDILPACEGDWQTQRSNWLRVAHSIAQSGRGTILCGTMMPDEVRRCDHFPMFRHVHFLNLHCDDETRARRLRGRPAWRQSGSDEFVEEHRKFAEWLVDHAASAFHPPMPTVDTSTASPREVAQRIRDWVHEHWDGFV